MCDVLCFGNTTDGQLGLGGIEEEQIFSARQIKFLSNKKINEISSNFFHSLILTEDGTVYSCGSNDYDQLGHDKPRRRPEFIDALETKTIANVRSGLHHSVALTNQGQIYTWGSNEEGQLGTNTKETTASPKLVKYFSDMVVVQIACGHHHTLVLTDDGRVHTWGSNEWGQLTVNPKIHPQPSSQPKVISRLHGLPIAQIACGAHHSFVLTVSGALFGWGLNKFGQLGVGDQLGRVEPALVSMLRSQEVVHVACGENHTAVLTRNGGVFTFGAGMYGQLGHGNTSSESNPKKIFELMGFVVSMVACGRNHTVVYVESKSKVYTFGLGSNGQLGSNTRSSSAEPTVAKSLALKKGTFVRCIYAGGDQTFVVISDSQSKYPQVDMRVAHPSQQIRTISNELIKHLSSSHKLDDGTEKDIKKVFSSVSCWNASFLNKEKLHESCDKKNHGVDITACEKMFQAIYNCNCGAVKDLVDSTVENLVASQLVAVYLDMEAIKWAISLPATYYFVKVDRYLDTVIAPFVRSLNDVDRSFPGILENWWHSCILEYQIHLIKVVLYYVFIIFSTSSHYMKSYFNGIIIIINIFQKVLKNIVLPVLKDIERLVNQLRDNPLDYTIFYIEGLDDHTDLDIDYIIWTLKNVLQMKTVPFCDYPFIFNGMCKTKLLHADSKIQMGVPVNEAQQQNLMSWFLPVNPQNPTLDILVSRNNIVQDTLSQLSKHEDKSFKKPLKVIFLGEDALDAGGLKKEFFMLLLKDLLDPKYGMFLYSEESRLIWFNSHSFEASDMYRLIGVICGLAIYNNNIISINFPLILFKKLLNKLPATLEDLKELQPTTARGLQTLLDYKNNDITEVFALTFEITRDHYGKVLTIPLVENGSSIEVTNENKMEYVDAYVDYIFNKSVLDQFTAFSHGFLKVCGSRILELFQPLELQAMVIGNENYDWDELEANAAYKNYDKNDEVIKFFWQAFRELTLEEKKKFLLFLTGCDRIPIHGMKAIKLTIQMMGGSLDLLPVAHTCFNILDLPRYQTKEILKKKLLQAIEHTQGFGLV
ncbi:hypothetical protein HELRODRAFT_114744 [Helobdella robusta]|uniref:HECT domain-containing protein n=1 Tax=Helobdella robusta TaxID=6412 RepID=T1EG44_HELRO|nr:hypothetical protein HELRODRAFT_114744 [Helobdella robusta]ESN95343.1 hypothetical protein HELRODRAFT_114744 [Helobdella robusta]